MLLLLLAAMPARTISLQLLWCRCCCVGDVGVARSRLRGATAVAQLPVQLTVCLMPSQDTHAHTLTSTGWPSGPMISGRPFGPSGILRGGDADCGRPDVLGCWSWGELEATITCRARLQGDAEADARVIG